MLEIKNTEIINAFYGLISSLDMAEERGEKMNMNICMSMETSKTEMHREKKE